MLTRIVRMEFQQELVGDFLILFKETYPLIRNFQGCRFLELYQDDKKANVYYTISYWDSVESLEKYRESELFGTTWKKTKAFFSAKPQAFSLNKVVEDPTNPG